MRERWCKVCTGWHDPENWPHNCMPERMGVRGNHAAPRLALDTMEPVQSMLDGKLYDSKSALRATYKQAGVTEVGNDSSVLDPKPPKRKKASRQEVRASVAKAMSQAGLGA